MSNISLWQIEDSIIGLSEIIESPDTSEEEKAAARAELERWAAQEVVKVDRVRSFLRHCQVMSDAAKFEADAMRRRGAQWEERGKRLKEIVIAAMQARGMKRLEGQSGILRTQAAGGKQSLVITNEPMVPDEYRIFSFHLSAQDWGELQWVLSHSPASGCATRILRAMMATVESKIINEAIRKVLETPCAVCGGAGIMGHIHAGADSENVPCAECNGTGRKLVPGATLADRQTVLRVE